LDFDNIWTALPVPTARASLSPAAKSCEKAGVAMRKRDSAVNRKTFFFMGTFLSWLRLPSNGWKKLTIKQGDARIPGYLFNLVTFAQWVTS
jgi:hypothetical protein